MFWLIIAYFSLVDQP